MLEKWKQWAIRMNFKKAVIIYIITAFVLSAGKSYTGSTGGNPLKNEKGFSIWQSEIH